MPKLNQIIAIEKGTKARAAARLTELYHLSQKPALFSGINRTYEPDQDGDAVYPPESQLVQNRVPEVLEQVAAITSELFDVIYTKDSGNQTAAADIVVGDEGTILARDVPVETLLFLEKELINVRTQIGALPTLSPEFVWHPDPSARAQYATEPVTTKKMKKVTKVLTLAPATDKHPAQVQPYQEDVLEGTWTQVRLSGGIYPGRREELLERVETLINAVKMARTQANELEVSKRTIGRDLFDWLLS